jgi:hypothetical protein
VTVEQLRLGTVCHKWREQREREKGMKDASFIVSSELNFVGDFKLSSGNIQLQTVHRRNVRWASHGRVSGLIH